MLGIAAVPNNCCGKQHDKTNVSFYLFQSSIKVPSVVLMYNLDT